MTQMLFGPDPSLEPLPPAHRTTDPATSAESDRLLTSSGARVSLATRCLWYIQGHPDQTVGEISTGMGLTSWQVSKRVSDLKNAGLVAPSGVRLYGTRRQQTWREVEYVLP